MFRLNFARTAALVVSLFASPAAAQDVASLPSAAPPPAHLAFVDGSADLVREGVVERATEGIMLVDGDVVRTLNGRAEIVFADGSVLHLNHDTELEILSPLRLRLTTGRVLLRVSAAATTPYTIDAQAASTRFFARGEYDMSADRRAERLEVAVSRGTAEIDDGQSPTVVRGGEMASILGAGGRVHLQAFNSARFDAFERWSSDRVNGFTHASSSRHVPAELRAYGPVFDNYGRWDYVAPYGNVWFPAVGATWRPYYTGAWRLTRYGWTWIGADPWAWPTHHYGRWGFTGASWYWIPHRTWGPAWVSWVFVPGYVSWAPLGWDNRAVLRWSPRRGDHPAYWPDYEPYRGWTVVPREHFGNRRPVRAHAVDPARLPDDTRRAIANVGVPRAATAGGGAVVVPGNEMAVPRGTTAPDSAGAPRNPDPWRSPRRGNVRAPEAAPADPWAAAPPANYDPPSSQPSGGVERRSPGARDPDNTTPNAYPPRVYAPRSDPARPSGAAGDDRPRRDPGRAAPRDRSERPQSGDASPGGDRAQPAPRAERDRDRGQSGGYAVPRRGGEPSQAAPAPAPAPQSGGQSGGARRRPPK